MTKADRSSGWTHRPSGTRRSLRWPKHPPFQKRESRASGIGLCCRVTNWITSKQLPESSVGSELISDSFEGGIGLGTPILRVVCGQARYRGPNISQGWLHSSVCKYGAHFHISRRRQRCARHTTLSFISSGPTFLCTMQMFCVKLQCCLEMPYDTEDMSIWSLELLVQPCYSGSTSPKILRDIALSSISP
ncbi:predicted protein [Coccidioides posadasii str. Silveira]|uniref:Predicted protein n=1 Tax=Coccidioides posadasii (strain RMSCC 757 / Silveira) TaxID=443226 RepID=E9D118_COCPS|nr:predicted protein [Coccidioides posadasii str. Silveira]